MLPYSLNQFGCMHYGHLLSSESLTLGLFLSANCFISRFALRNRDERLARGIPPHLLPLLEIEIIYNDGLVKQSLDMFFVLVTCKSVCTTRYLTSLPEPF